MAVKKRLKSVQNAVQKTQRKKRYKVVSNAINVMIIVSHFAQKEDLNAVSSADLMKVYGIGETLSERIVAYRTRYGDFVADVQLQEVYGLSPEVIKRVLNEYTVKTDASLTKINVNEATLEQLVTIKYIDYEIAHNIIEQRTLREGFKSFDELTKVKDFPVKKSEIIRLYLTFN